MATKKPAKGRTKSPKTTTKTAIPPLIPRPDGRGALRAGGTPGNKGGTGRPKAEYKKFWREALTDPKTRAAVKRALADEKSSAFVGTLKIGSDRAFGPVEKKVKVSGELSLAFAETMREARERLKAAK